MGAGAVKEDCIFAEFIHEEPVRLNVTFGPTRVRTHAGGVPSIQRAKASHGQ
jgi:hypothetical protein